MKQQIVIQIVAASVLAVACGRDEAKELRQHAALSQRRAPTNQAARQTVQADLSCTGPSLDHSRDIIVLGFKGDDATYQRADLEDSAANTEEIPQLIGSYDQRQVLTPPPPTDIRFRYLFSAKTPQVGDYTVTLTEGGFTDKATSEVRRVTIDGSVVVADLTCT